MGNVITMTVFVWTLNVLIFLAQASMINLNPDTTILYYSPTNGPIGQYVVDGNMTPNSNIISSELNPDSAQINGGEPVTQGGTGIWFIDAISSVKNWIANKINYFINIVMGPYNILKVIPGLPPSFIGAICLIWYGASLFLLVLTIFGRNT